MPKSNKKRNSVRVSSKEAKKEEQKKIFTKKIVISIISIIFCILAGTILGWINGYSGEYYLNITHIGIAFIPLIIGINKKISENNLIFILVYILIVICSVIIIFANVKAERNKNKVISEENIYQLLEKEQIGNISISEDNMFRKAVYIMKEDPYFENGLEKYVGELKNISDDKMIELMVEILLENLNNNGNQEKRERSEIYDKHTRIANQRYKVYQFQCDLEKEDGIMEEDLVQDRLSDLESSLKSREYADQEYRDSENERLMGVGYRELGDEYKREGDLEKASDAYKESGKWFMCAIYLAATTQNYEKIYKCQKGFKALNKEIQSIDETNNTIKHINISLKVYNLFIKEVCK